MSHANTLAPHRTVWSLGNRATTSRLLVVTVTVSSSRSVLLLDCRLTLQAYSHKRPKKIKSGGASAGRPRTHTLAIHQLAALSLSVSKPTAEKEPGAGRLLCPLVELTIDFLLSVINAVLTTKQQGNTRTHTPGPRTCKAHTRWCKMFFVGGSGG